MKTKLLLKICILATLFSCSRERDDLIVPIQKNVEIQVPRSSEIYGKEVAKEIRTLVTNLNQKGYSFPKIKNMKQTQEFFRQSNAASSTPVVKSGGGSLPDIDFAALKKSQSELTGAQKEIILLLVDAHRLRKSDEDFKQRIVEINNQIGKKVPEFERERLYNLTSTLFYTFKEIKLLEQQGMTVRNGINAKNNLPRLKSGTENSDGGSSGNCRQENSWSSIAIGFINSAGEKVTSVVKAANASLALWIITWCMDDQIELQAHCAEAYQQCQNSGNPYWTSNMPGTSQSRCGKCMLDCVRERGWPCGFNFR